MHLKRRPKIHWILQAMILLLSAYLLAGIIEIVLPGPLAGMFQVDLNHPVIDVTLNGLIGLLLYLIYRWLVGELHTPFLRNKPGNLLTGTLCGVGLVAGIAGILYLTGSLRFTGWAWSKEIFGYLAFFVSISWVEEMLTRGAIQHLIQPHSKWLAIVESEDCLD